MAVIDFRSLARRRTLFLVASVLLFLPPLALIFQVTTGDTSFCGRWCPRMFFVWREGMTLQQYLLGWVRSPLGVALLLSVVAATLAAGRWWCSHLCPVGALTELGSRVVPEKLRLRFDALPAAPVRYGYLSVYLLAPVFGLGSLCCSYCNFATAPRLLGAAFSSADLAFFLRTAGVINLALILGLGFFVRGGRAYCNFLCPVGAIDALAARFGGRFGRRVRLDPVRCTACGQCRDVCPVWAIDLEGTPRIDQLSCIPCGECDRVCPEGAVRYGREPGPEKKGGGR